MSISDAPTSSVLAFDLGGTRLKAGLVRGCEVTALSITSLEGDDDSESVVRHLLAIGHQLLAASDVQAIGICVRGIVDSQQGMILDVNGPLGSLISYPLSDVMSKHFGIPVVMENDARMYALGEWQHGAGQGCTNLVSVTLGTGVGSGVILNKRLLRGTRHVAGILGGHFTVQADGPVCSCGNRGCLEMLIGTPALVQMATDGLKNAHSSQLQRQSITPQNIFAAAGNGDMLACEIVEHFARTLGAGIVTLIHAYDPDKVVLGGGFIHSQALFLPQVQMYVQNHAWCIPRGRIPIVPALLGDMAALVGVATLASLTTLATNEPIFL